MLGFLQKIRNKSQIAEAALLLSGRNPALCAELKTRGNALLTEGLILDAGQCYRDATLADSQDASAFVNLGYALLEQKRLVEARIALEQAIALDLGQFNAHFMLGSLAQQQGDTPQAIFRFREVLKINPQFELAYRELGYELFRDEQTEESERVMLEAIGRFPLSADLLCNLGSLYSVQNIAAKAVDSYEKALSLQPDCAEILGNLGAAYDSLGEGKKGRQLMLRALELDPGNADLQSNLGTHLWANGLYQEALQHFHASVVIDPNHGVGHMHVGLSNLLMGNNEQGWLEYEWRFKGAGHLASALKARKLFPQPLWLGAELLQGKTILLHCEQGYGDTIQFCRYAPEVAALGAVVVLQVQQGLKGLLKTLPGVTHLLEEGEPLPNFDLRCPLMSLPLALGHHTTGIAPISDAYLKADPERVKYWRQQLVAMGSPRIGVAWSGNPQHGRDRHRSMTLSAFSAMLPLGMNVVCLQPDVREADLPVARADTRIKLPGSELKTFADTAALVMALDLVISVDTSVAHLAGALGKPVWVLVSHVPDWRWQLDREDTPWYPGAKIFRQAAIEDWSRPVEEIRGALLRRYRPAVM